MGRLEKVVEFSFPGPDSALQLVRAEFWEAGLSPDRVSYNLVEVTEDGNIEIDISTHIRDKEAKRLLTWFKRMTDARPQEA